MWFQREKKIADRWTVLAFIGGLFIITIIIFFTVVVEKRLLFGNQSEIDGLVPATAQFYLHIDLDQKGLKSMENNDNWRKFLINGKQEITKILPKSFDPDQLFSQFAGEIAFFQFSDKSPGFISSINSADQMRELLSASGGQVVKIEKISGLTVTTQKTDLLLNYCWTEIKKNIFVFATSSQAIEQIISIKNKQSDSIETRLTSYHPTDHFIYGLIQGNKYLENIPNDFIKSLLSLYQTELDEIYFDLNLEEGRLKGQLSNYSPTLLETLSSGDIEDIYLQLEKYLPINYQTSLLRVNPTNFFSDLSEAQVGSADSFVFDWPRYFTEATGFDWEDNILTLLDRATDITIGQSNGEQPSEIPFLISFQPKQTEQFADSLNNIETLIRKVIGIRYPQRLEKILSDGSKVTELLPDPQAGKTEQLKIDDQIIENLQLITLPDSQQMVFGQWQKRIVFSNSVDLVKSIIQKPKEDISQAPACLEDLKGKQLLILDQAYLAEINPLGRNIKKIYLSDGSKDERIYLNYCIEF